MWLEEQDQEKRDFETGYIFLKTLIRYENTCESNINWANDLFLNIFIGKVIFLGQNTGIQKPYPQNMIPQNWSNHHKWLYSNRIWANILFFKKDCTWLPKVILSPKSNKPNYQKPNYSHQKLWKPNNSKPDPRNTHIVHLYIIITASNFTQIIKKNKDNSSNLFHLSAPIMVSPEAA